MTGALVMVHAENGDAIDVLVKQALANGQTEPHWHALTRPPETEGEATNRAIQLARVAGCPLYVVHVSCKESVEPIALARAEGLGRLGRDVHAVLLRRLDVPRAAELRGREVRLHAAAARQGEPGGALGRGAHRRALGDLDRPLRVQLGRPEDARQRRLLEDPERRPRPREPAADDPHTSASARAGSRSTGWSSCSRRTRRSCSGSTRARARSRSAPTPTSSSSTRRSASRSGGDAPLAHRLQPLRGHRGRRLAGDRAAARQRARRERRARREARHRPVRRAREVRRRSWPAPARAVAG